MEYTSTCKAKIDAARTAYNDLSDAQKALVENYETLTEAESRYAELKGVALPPITDVPYKLNLAKTAAHKLRITGVRHTAALVKHHLFR